MKELCYDLLTIAAIVVFVVDISGFTAAWKRAVARLLHRSPDVIRFKPFDCSLCLTFWAGLIYVIWTGWFSLMAVLLVCAAAAVTEVIAAAANAVLELAKAVIDTVFRIIDKIMDRK